MKILFIINPKSGKGRDPQEIIDAVTLNFPQASWALTEGPGHATQLAQKAVQQNYEAVAAVGGDGTINETARALVHTQTALGVIPNGSGNGLAREMGMPLSVEEALLRLQTPRPLLFAPLSASALSAAPSLRCCYVAAALALIKSFGRE